MKHDSKSQTQRIHSITALITVFTLVSCSDQEDLTRSLSPEWNQIVLISMDTTRSDHLGCYGGMAPTPRLDGLAKDGVLFETVYTPTPITLPAHTTLFTGTHPLRHGAKDNGLVRISEQAHTLAEMFSDAGWDTLGVIGAFVLDSQFGLDQGFDYYDDDFQVGLGGSIGKEERKADKVTDAALALLHDMPAVDTAPLFLFVHYFDPHLPWNAPTPFSQQVEDPYDAEIAYMDHHIGRLVDSLNNRSDKTLYCLVSDHGESLGEHGEKTHGLFLYDATVRVPCIFSGPGVQVGERVNSTASLMDIAPTLVELAGLVEFSGEAGSQTFQGTSLASSIRVGGSKDSGKTRELVLETRLPLTNFGWAPQSALVADGWKWIQSPNPERYDLAKDPNEIRNQLGVDSLSDEKMVRRLDLAMQRLTSPPSEPWVELISVNNDAREMLAALGYLVGDHENEDQPKDLIDAKDGVAQMGRVNAAISAQNSGRFDVAIRMYRRILKENPASSFVAQHLGTALVGAKRYRESIPILEKILRSRPGIPTVKYNLAHAYFMVGNAQRALALINEVTEENPKFSPAYQWLGLYYESRKNTTEAIRAYERLLNHWKGDAARADAIRAKLAKLKESASEGL